MNDSKININRILLAVSLFLALLAVAILNDGSGMANALEKQLEVGPRDINEPLNLICSVTLHIEGSGQVTTKNGDGQAVILSQASDQLQKPCGTEVTLTARPDSLWRFDHWQGVTDSDIQTQTIAITTPAEVTAVFVPRASVTVTLDEPYYRAGEAITSFERLEPLWQSLSENELNLADNEPPTIEIWYGDTQTFTFGQHGTPQQWMNILGNVSDPNPGPISLSYTLNGEASQPLNYGGDGSDNDGRRLANEGDFNVDLDKDELKPGPNQVIITAADSVNPPVSTTVTVYYNPDKQWPVQYGIDWNSVPAVQDAVQIVDGKWERLEDGSGVHIVETGYDRILSIGEGSFARDIHDWTEFEVLVEVTIHKYKEAGFSQLAPAVGLVARWEGHTDETKLTCQPKCGYVPFGAAGWYSWKPVNRNPFVSMFANDGKRVSVPTNQTPTMKYNKPYYWKMRVENLDKPTGTYSFTIWEKGAESPTEPLITFDESLHVGEIPMLTSGSVFLLSHHVDVTFGDVQVCPLDGCEFDPPEISNVSVEPGINEATVSWSTNEPATSRVDYSSGSGDDETMSDETLVTEHSLVLPNLAADTTYDFQVFSTDAAGNLGTSEPGEFTTNPGAVQTYSLSVLTDGQGTVSVVPDKQLYDSGEQVTLTAVPSTAQSYFSNWSIDVVSDENPLLLVITEDTEVQANFELVQVEDYTYYLPMALGN